MVEETDYETLVKTLCTIAGFPERAAAHIAARTPIAALRTELVNARALAQCQTEIHTARPTLVPLRLQN